MNSDLPDVPLEQREILRYLGYKRQHELTPELAELVAKVMVEVQKVSQVRSHYQFFDLAETSTGIQIVGSDLVLSGTAISRHLQGATSVALFALTLGSGVEQVIRRYEITDLTHALVLEVACTEYVEKLCDLTEARIAKEAQSKGLTANRRFSPGYGDLPLAIQPTFLATLQAERTVGITVTQDFLMIPRKSVTAIVGLFPAGATAKPTRKEPDWCQAYLSKEESK